MMWIVLGILLLGVGLLIWAIRKLLAKPAVEAPTDDGVAASLEDDLPTPELDPLLQAKPKVVSPPPPSSFFKEDKRAAPTPNPVAASAPAASASSNAPPVLTQEVVDRLDTMSKQLSEMQTVLARQASAPPPQPSAEAQAAAQSLAQSLPQPSLGQGFTPETIDRLLRIIGTVTQQVDVLQKSLGSPPKAGPADASPKPFPFVAPPAKPVAAPVSAPAAKPAAPASPMSNKPSVGPAPSTSGLPPVSPPSPPAK